MSVNYNNFAKSFAQSRKNMHWPELEYFFSLMRKEDRILDIACGSGRLLQAYYHFFRDVPKEYIWIDISEDLLSEAMKDFPKHRFFLWDMRLLTHTLWHMNFNAVFCIAWFHHLESIEDRERTLLEIHECLSEKGRVYMTNWSLHTSKNLKKYKNSQRGAQQDNFGSYDYDIKIWAYTRYYHSFSLSELQYLSEKTWFKILENRLFDTERNTITILEK